MSTEPRLYGLPDAEELWDDPGAVWESDIQPWYRGGGDTWTIEEWTIRPNAELVGDPQPIAETVAEYASDQMGLEAGWDYWEAASKDPEVLQAFQKAMWLLASKVSYKQADERVAVHVVTLQDGDWGRPLLNGEPLDVPAVVPESREHLEPPRRWSLFHPLPKGEHMSKYKSGDVVSVDGYGAYTVSVDNGHAVWLADLPDRMAIDEGHMVNSRGVRHGDWGAPPRYNRWVVKSRVGIPETEQ